jgi:hypothetical protein
MLRGEPRNLDDCLDMAKGKGLYPECVVLDLKFLETPNEALIMVKQMFSVYTWQFKDKIVKCEELCGACIFTENGKRQIKSIDMANIRLKDSLSRINGLGIEVAGREKRFCYSTTYKCIPEEAP